MRLLSSKAVAAASLGLAGGLAAYHWIRSPDLFLAYDGFTSDKVCVAVSHQQLLHPALLRGGHFNVRRVTAIWISIAYGSVAVIGERAASGLRA